MMIRNVLKTCFLLGGIKLKLFLDYRLVTTLWPCYFGTFNFSLFQFSSFRCTWLFFRWHFWIFWMPFSVSEFAGLKNIYTYVYMFKKNLHKFPCSNNQCQGLSGMSSYKCNFFWRAPKVRPLTSNIPAKQNSVIIIIQRSQIV